MGTVKNIILSWPALVLGTCSLPFLPITGHTYLVSYEKNTKLGPYEVDVKIILSEVNGDKGHMNIDGYFYYPAAKLMDDGCFLEIEVKIEGQTQQEYPKDVVNTEYARNFPKEKIFDVSINGFNKSIAELSSKKHSLTLTLYDEPQVEQIYTLKLKPISEENHEFCDATVKIKHKVRRRRASFAQVAMSV